MEVLLSTTFYELPFIHSRYFAEAAQGYQGKTVTRQIHCYFFVFIVQFQITFCFPRSILIFLVLPLHSASRSLYVTDCCCLLPLFIFLYWLLFLTSVLIYGHPMRFNSRFSSQFPLIGGGSVRKSTEGSLIITVLVGTFSLSSLIPICFQNISMWKT